MQFQYSKQIDSLEIVWKIQDNLIANHIMVKFYVLLIKYP